MVICIIKSSDNIIDIYKIPISLSTPTYSFHRSHARFIILPAVIALSFTPPDTARITS